MAAATILRGFKVSADTFDAFLKANGLHETSGTPPFFDHHPDKDKVSVLLYSKIVKAGGTADKNKFRLELNLDQQLPVEIPEGFEELWEEILSFSWEEPLEFNKIPNNGKVGMFMVFTEDEPRGVYFPKEIYDRMKTPQHCDLCDMTFHDERMAFAYRQKHRIDAHGSKEGVSPLPEV